MGGEQGRGGVGCEGVKRPRGNNGTGLGCEAERSGGAAPRAGRSRSGSVRHPQWRIPRRAHSTHSTAACRTGRRPLYQLQPPER